MQKKIDLRRRIRLMVLVLPLLLSACTGPDEDASQSSNPESKMETSDPDSKPEEESSETQSSESEEKSNRESKTLTEPPTEKDKSGREVAPKAMNATFYRTDRQSGGRQPARLIRIRSVEEAKAYVVDNESEFQLYNGKERNFADDLMAFDKNFFNKQDLAVVCLEMGSGSARPSFLGYRPDGNGDRIQILVHIEGPGPGQVGTADMAAWHGYMPLPKGDEDLRLMIK